MAAATHWLTGNVSPLALSMDLTVCFTAFLPWFYIYLYVRSHSFVGKWTNSCVHIVIYINLFRFNLSPYSLSFCLSFPLWDSNLISFNITHPALQVAGGTTMSLHPVSVWRLWMKRSHSQCVPRQTLVAYDPLSPSELMRWSAALMCEPRLSRARRKHQQRVKQSAMSKWSVWMWAARLFVSWLPPPPPLSCNQPWAETTRFPPLAAVRKA